MRRSRLRFAGCSLDDADNDLMRFVSYLDSLRAGKAAFPRRVELLEWLERQKRAMQARGWAHWEIRLGMFECLTRQMTGDKPESLAVLPYALELASPRGYLRIVVKEGEPMRKLLQAYVETPSPIHNIYAQKLLAVSVDVDQTPPAQRQPSISLNR